MPARIIGVNVGDRGRFPYQLELENGDEILIPSDGPSHVRLDKPRMSPEQLRGAASFAADGATDGGFAECVIQDRSKQPG